MWELQGKSGDLGCVGLKLLRGHGQLLVVWCGWGLGARRAGVPHGHAALAELWQSLPPPAHPGVVLKPDLIFP